MIKLLGNLCRIVSLIWVLPTILVWLLLYPICKFKIAYIEVSRIGNSILEFFSALEYKKSRVRRTKFYILIEKSNPANFYWESLIHKHLVVAPYFLNDIHFWIKKFKITDLFLADMFSPIKNEKRSSNTNLMSEQDNSYCVSILEKNNILIKEPFIVLHIRDSKYLEYRNKNKDWSYHSYRDSNIETYRDTVNYLISLGYYVVRTGRNMEKELKIDSDNFLDYSFSNTQDDKLDIWLFLNSSAIISTGSGPDMLGIVNEKPILFLNILPLSNFHYYLNCMWGPKILTDLKTGKFLTLENYLKSNFTRTEDYKLSGIEFSDLTSTDIMEITREFIEHKLSNQTSMSNSVIQEIFWQQLYLNNGNIYKNNKSKKARLSEYWFKKYLENE